VIISVDLFFCIPLSAPPCEEEFVPSHFTGRKFYAWFLAAASPDRSSLPRFFDTSPDRAAGCCGRPATTHPPMVWYAYETQPHTLPCFFSFARSSPPKYVYRERFLFSCTFGVICFYPPALLRLCESSFALIFLPEPRLGQFIRCVRQELVFYHSPMSVHIWRPMGPSSTSSIVAVDAPFSFRKRHGLWSLAFSGLKSALLPTPQR